MSENLTPQCPECASPDSVDRRLFLKATAGAVAVAGVAGTARVTLANEAPKKVAKDATKVKPAEALIKELFAEMTAEQKKKAVFDFDKKRGNMFERQGMYNAAVGSKISDVYTKAQMELVERIVKAISSGDDGYNQITRGGTWDNSKEFGNCGANIYGDPSGTGKFAFLFTGHHLTIRCDGNSEEGAAFGGPIYYGHTPNGYSDRNIFFYQTKQVMNVYDALSEKQRKVAVIVKDDPGEQIGSVQLKGKRRDKIGLSYGELSKDQQALVQEVMHTILSPFRKEDADEVMEIIKATGGMEKLHLGFFDVDGTQDATKRWKYWRIEGPGFVWNYRVLPHVHTFVNISSKVS